MKLFNLKGEFVRREGNSFLRNGRFCNLIGREKGRRIWKYAGTVVFKRASRFSKWSNRQDKEK